MDGREQRMVELLVEAALAQVERGHFQEAYEGFNDCPAWRFGRRDKGYTESWLDIDQCNCGIREALDALDVAADLGWFHPEGGWDGDVR